MDVKKRKRCSERLRSKANKLLEVGVLQTEEQKRCMEWIQSQKTPKRARKTLIDRNAINKYDKTPETPTDSLSVLKKVKVNQGVLYICEWKDCLREFDEAEELHSHVRMHITELNPIRRKYFCSWDLCHFQTDCGDEITRHIFYHAYHTILKTVGESLTQKVKIPRCTNDSRNRNLIPELKSDFECRWNDCNERFKSIRSFHLHAREHVSFENKTLKRNRGNVILYCQWNECEKSFSVAYRLLEHLKTHIKEKVVGCYHCGTLFFNNTNFFDHCKRQEASQEFQCAQCLKYFSSERLLRMHVQVHVNSHKCSICEMTCNSKYQLARHVRYRHIAEKPIQCTLCDYKTVRKSDLDTHVLYTHKKKPLPCSEAGCKFIAKSLHFLRKHESEVHTKTIYACHCCEKQYKHGRELSKHLKKVHKYEMLPGHRRFTYRMDETGLYRLQTLRIESLEVTEQVSSPQNSMSGNYEGISLHITKFEETSSDQKSPFKIITTHDTDFEHLDLPDKFEEKFNGEPLDFSSDVIITFKEIDDEGNVIQSKCISGNKIEMS